MARRSRGPSLPVAPRAWRAPIPSPRCPCLWHPMVIVRVGWFVRVDFCSDVSKLSALGRPVHLAQGHKLSAVGDAACPPQTRLSLAPLTASDTPLWAPPMISTW